MTDLPYRFDETKDEWPSWKELMESMTSDEFNELFNKIAREYNSSTQPKTNQINEIKSE